MPDSPDRIRFTPFRHLDSRLRPAYRRLPYLALVLGLNILFPPGSRADSASDWQRMQAIVPKGYVAHKVAHPPVIDGRLDDSAWKQLPWTDDFQDIEGAQKPRPRFRTRAKMAWDDEYFYVAARMEEPHVWGTLTQHDSVIFHDNDFEIFIDPDGDNHEYYEFEINALNTGWDLFLPRPYKDGGKADNGWEIPGLKTAIHIDGTLNDPGDTDDGWSVEIALPWQVLRQFAHRPAPPNDGDQWRINFSRVEWRHQVVDGKYSKVPNRKEDNWVWSPQGIIDMHRPERWGYVQFSTGSPGAVPFRTDPTLAGRDLLMSVYHRQKSYQQKNQRWAGSLDELDLKPDAWREFAAAPTLQLTDQGYQATLHVPVAGDQTQAWHVRQDSKLWTESEGAGDMVDEIRNLSTTQAAAWNRGDLDAFMAHYWKSDQLTFSSGGTTTRGWHTTRDNYRKRYPTRERMGTLTFDNLEVFALSDDAALTLGQWHLQRAPEPVGGNFSLVLRRLDGRWLITHDHTSRRESAASETP
jgi:ketosteroid isomerase-like protein